MKRDSVCGNCESDDRWILHHVHHRNTFRRVCTTCVLKLNMSSFCPICFSLHERAKKSPACLVCLKCNSSSHTACVGPNTPKSPYLCPTCSNPNLKLFDLRKSGDAIDLKSCKVFLAAAMIAENSLKEEAKVVAERKAKESVAARKRAKEALERSALVHNRDQERMRRTDQETTTPNNNNSADVDVDVNVNVNDNGGTFTNVNGQTVFKASNKDDV